MNEKSVFPSPAVTTASQVSSDCVNGSNAIRCVRVWLPGGGRGGGPNVVIAAGDVVGAGGVVIGAGVVDDCVVDVVAGGVVVAPGGVVVGAGGVGVVDDVDVGGGVGPVDPPGGVVAVVVDPEEVYA